MRVAVPIAEGRRSVSPAVRPPPRQALWPILAGAASTQLIYVVAKLGVADCLADGPLSIAELSRKIGAHPAILRRIMHGLVSLGILLAEGGDYFSLTPLGGYLRSNVVGSMREWAIIWGEMHYRAWGGLLHVVREGGAAFEYAVGKSTWPYLADDHELARIFHSAMVREARQETAILLDAYSFSPLQRIVDIGGGRGAAVAAVLKAYPYMTGLLYDTPSGLEGAKELLKSEGVADRCDIVMGNFFTYVPSGGDIYLLKNVLHNWDDENCLSILRNCREAISKAAKLLVVELVMPDPPGQNPLA